MQEYHVTQLVENNWERELASLLGDLSAVQSEMLEVLDAKREHIVKGDVTRSQDLDRRAEQLLGRLQEFHQRRTQLMQFASQNRMPCDSLGRMATHATGENRGKLAKQVKQTSMRMRQLHHQCIASWVLAQRSLLHVAQMLEIIATGGRLQPTYGKGEPDMSGGALVDHEA